YLSVMPLNITIRRLTSKLSAALETFSDATSASLEQAVSPTARRAVAVAATIALVFFTSEPFHSRCSSSSLRGWLPRTWCRSCQSPQQLLRRSLSPAVQALVSIRAHTLPCMEAFRCLHRLTHLVGRLLIGVHCVGTVNVLKVRMGNGGVACQIQERVLKGLVDRILIGLKN